MKRSDRIQGNGHDPLLFFAESFSMIAGIAPRRKEQVGGAGGRAEEAEKEGID